MEFGDHGQVASLRLEIAEAHIDGATVVAERVQTTSLKRLGAERIGDAASSNLGIMNRAKHELGGVLLTSADDGSRSSLDGGSRKGKGDGESLGEVHVDDFLVSYWLGGCVGIWETIRRKGGFGGA